MKKAISKWQLAISQKRTKSFSREFANEDESIHLIRVLRGFAANFLSAFYQRRSAAKPVRLEASGQ
jgi:hypothetical protein